MHDNLMKKMAIFSILVLLIGVTVAPSISGNTKKISNMQDADNAESEKLISDQKTWTFPDDRATPLDWPVGPGATEVVSTESTEDSWFPSLVVDFNRTVHVAW